MTALAFRVTVLCLALTSWACTCSPAVEPSGSDGGGQGGDGGSGAIPDSGIPPSSCLVEAPTGLLAQDAGAVVVLGDFRVAVSSDARLDVGHVAFPGRSLFSSAAGAPLEIARVDLSVTDQQGSFSIQETLRDRCALPVLEGLRAGNGTLVVQGGFVDAAPACAAVHWELQLCQAQTGHLSFRLRSTDASFTRLTLNALSPADEAIFGLGEQFAHDQLSLKGRRIPVLSQEGGVGRGHTPITQLVNAVAPGSGGSEDATYFAAPHVLTSQLRSLFLEDTELALFDFTGPAAMGVTLYAPTMTGRILAGGSPLELIERYTEYAGRMPPPPAWVDEGAILGLARDLSTSRTIVDSLRAHGVRIAGVWNQTWSGKVRTSIGEQVLWNWVQDPVSHPDWQAFVGDLADGGTRTLCYVNPMFVDASDAGTRRNLYAEAADAGYLVRTQSGAPYLIKVTAFDVGLLDLSNPPARAWMKQVLRDEVMGAAHCSGWMVDFAEALPFDGVLAAGVPASRFHNQYPVEWMRVNREAIEEAGRLGDVLTFNRSGSARTPGVSLLLWEGDQLTTWDKYDGLVSALHGLISGGFSGIALNHSDTGGYTSLSANGIFGYEREAEQLKRWTELSAFTSVLRTHEGNQPSVNAQVYSDAAAMDHFARFTRVYRALRTYRRQVFAEAAERGWPVARALWLHAPGDARALAVDDEFTLGSEVLVAPIKNKCFTWPSCPYQKAVYLPKGEWVHLWSGQVYGSSTGGADVTVAAPIGQPAVFYRRGSPMAATLVAALAAEGIAVPAPP